MKKLFLLKLVFGLTITAYTQNIGIGTTTPRGPLSFPPLGGSKIILWDDGNASGNSYGIGVQPGRLQIHTYTANDDVVFGYGRSDEFNEVMRIKGNGRVGIGNTSPAYPLSFANILGDKIALWGGSGPHYGFGVQSTLLQIHSDVPTSDIAFGTGSSTSFSEMLRIKGTGVLQFSPTSAKKIIMNVGATGDAGMSISGTELRIGSESNAGDIVFGYDNRASGFGERLRIKGNGVLSINGNSGVAGQVLVAGSGPGGVTSWDYGLTKAFRNSNATFAPLNNNGDETTIASVTVTVQKTSMISITGTVWLNTTFCFGCGDASVYLLMNDPTASGPEFIVAANPHVINMTTMNFTYSPRFNVSPGSYTFTLRARKVSGSGVVSGIDADPNYKSDICRLTALVTPI